MKNFKLFLIIALCFSVFSASIAQAAMLCCLNSQSSHAEMTQTKVGAEMPCHSDGATKQSTPSNICKNCKDCISSGATLIENSSRVASFQPIIHRDEDSTFTSFEPRHLESPPKLIS